MCYHKLFLCLLVLGRLIFSYILSWTTDFNINNQSILDLSLLALACASAVDNTLLTRLCYTFSYSSHILLLSDIPLLLHNKSLSGFPLSILNVVGLFHDCGFFFCIKYVV